MRTKIIINLYIFIYLLVLSIIFLHMISVNQSINFLDYGLNFMAVSNAPTADHHNALTVTTPFLFFFFYNQAAHTPVSRHLNMSWSVTNLVRCVGKYMTKPAFVNEDINVCLGTRDPRMLYFTVQLIFLFFFFSLLAVSGRVGCLTHCG